MEDVRLNSKEKIQFFGFRDVCFEEKVEKLGVRKPG